MSKFLDLSNITQGNNENTSFNPEDPNFLLNYLGDGKKKFSKKSETKKMEIYAKYINYCLIQMHDDFIKKKY